MTNAEKIKSMTDEELSHYLPSADCYNCPIQADINDCYCTSSCYECALNWLKKEAEE